MAIAEIVGEVLPEIQNEFPELRKEITVETQPQEQDAETMGLTGEVTTHTFLALELKTTQRPYTQSREVDGTNLNVATTVYLYETAAVPIELTNGMNCTINNEPHRIVDIEFIPSRAMGKLYIRKLI